MLLLACTSSAPATRVWRHGELAFEVPVHWQEHADGIGDPRTTRCSAARLQVVAPIGRPDGTTVEGERCMLRTTRRTIGPVQIVCTEGWERDGLGDPASVCAPVVQSAH